MHRDRLEYLKRAIKRTYKRYIGERADAKATLLDVVQFFNISIDEARVEDYIVKNIDYNNLSIEIMDVKSDISYTAAYTGEVELLNYCGPVEFNLVTSISPIRKEERLYYIGSKTPIVTKATFTNGEYDLVFEKEVADSSDLFLGEGVGI